MLRPFRILVLTICVAFFVSATVITGTGAVLGDPATELPRADDASGSVTGVPDYKLVTFKGTELRLSSLRGHVVLLDFFSATCPHCRRHAPFISNLAKRYRDSGLVVINLSSNNPYVDREQVESYVREATIENEVVWSPIELFMLYMTPNAEGIYGVPQAVLFGIDGRVAARFTKFEEQDKAGIEQTIAKQLGKSVNSPS